MQHNAQSNQEPGLHLLVPMLVIANWCAVFQSDRPAACLLSLQEPSSIEKVAEIDEHIGCAMSGLTADAKTLVDHARSDTQVRHGIVTPQFTTP